MILSQGRLWRLEARGSDDAVTLSLVRDGVRDAGEAEDLKDPGIEVPLSEWSRVVKHRAERKLLGGILLGFVKNEKALAAVLASDRMFCELGARVEEATAVLVEKGRMQLVPPGDEHDGDT